MDSSHLRYLTLHYKDYKNWVGFMSVKARTGIRNACAKHTALEYQTRRAAVQADMLTYTKARLTAGKMNAIVTDLQLTQVDRPAAYEASSCVGSSHTHFPGGGGSAGRGIIISGVCTRIIAARESNLTRCSALSTRESSLAVFRAPEPPTVGLSLHVLARFAPRRESQALWWCRAPCHAAMRGGATKVHGERRRRNRGVCVRCTSCL